MEIEASAGQLSERIRRGDAEAEGVLYERFGRRIRFLATRELRSSFKADDVESETILRVIRALREGRLREAEALPGFVLQTARNVIREHRRHDQRYVALDPTEAPVAEPVAADPPEQLDQHVLSALRSAVGTLNTRDRAFLRLHYVDELPRAEIARRLGVSEERVRLVKSRALRRFREAYQDVAQRAGLDVDTSAS